MLSICLRWAFLFLGIMGAILVGYGLIAYYTGEQWSLLERVPSRYYSLVTIVAAIFTALSVYVPTEKIHPPDIFSKTVSAPLVIVFGFGAMRFWYLAGDLPSTVLNGLALLGLAGTFFRIQPKPEGF